MQVQVLRPTLADGVACMPCEETIAPVMVLDVDTATPEQMKKAIKEVQAKERSCCHPQYVMSVEPHVFVGERYGTAFAVQVLGDRNALLDVALIQVQEETGAVRLVRRKKRESQPAPAVGSSEPS